MEEVSRSYELPMIKEQILGVANKGVKTLRTNIL
jgi:hypothetical protein